MRAAGAGGEDGGSSALLLCAAGDGVGPAALLSLPRRAQVLVNAPEGVSRLALEHRVRPTGRLAALLLTSLSPDAAVRRSIRITYVLAGSRPLTAALLRAGRPAGPAAAPGSGRPRRAGGGWAARHRGAGSSRGGVCQVGASKGACAQRRHAAASR